MASVSVEDLYRLDDAAVKTTVLTLFLFLLEACAFLKAGLTFASLSPNGFPDKEKELAQLLGEQPLPREFRDGLSNNVPLNNVASGLVCSAVARSALYGFSKTIDQHKADAYWRTQLGTDSAITQGRALYDWAFPHYCKSVDLRFRDYLSTDPKGWAAALARHVTTAAFINNEIGKLIGGQGDWLEKLNLVFYKLHRLDPSVIPPVVDAWEKAYPNLALTPHWETYNYVDHTHFRDEQFLTEVNQAISEYAKTFNAVTYEGEGWICASRETGAGWPSVFKDIGMFLGGDAVNLGLTTGARPDVADSVCWPTLKPNL